MRKWIHALMLVLALSAAFPTTASTLSISGANSALAPIWRDTPPYLVNWATFDLDASSVVRFGQQQNVRLLSPGDIRIAGVINVSGFNLVLETPGQIFVTGPISAGSISLSNTALLAGSITLTPDALYLQPIGNITIRGPGSITLTVPEPATPWLVATLLPMLMLFRRKHTSYGGR